MQVLDAVLSMAPASPRYPMSLGCHGSMHQQGGAISPPGSVCATDCSPRGNSCGGSTGAWAHVWSGSGGVQPNAACAGFAGGGDVAGGAPGGVMSAPVMPLGSPINSCLGAAGNHSPCAGGISDLQASKELLLQHTLQEVETLRARAHHADEERRRCLEATRTLRGNIRIMGRVRPALGGEEDDIGCLRVMNRQQLEVLMEPRAQLTEQHFRHRRRSTGSSGGGFNQDSGAKTPGLGEADASTSSGGRNACLEPRTFFFDELFDSEADDEAIFSAVHDEVAAAVDGEAVCILAYGATGSGKTHTVSNLAERTARELERQAICLAQGGVRMEIVVQIVEIYNEQFRDLLAGEGTAEPPRLKLSVSSANPVLQSAASRTISTESGSGIAASLQEALRWGQAQRATSSTAVHGRSSRSHLVMTLFLTSSEAHHGTWHRSGKLSLVDLAGSERLKRSEAVGDQLREAQYINRSLSALADVIAAKERRGSHVPYRNSKLTLLLQDALGGQPECRTVIIVALPPTRLSLNDSLHSLQFSSRLTALSIPTVTRRSLPGVETGRLRRIPSASSPLAGVDESLGDELRTEVERLRSEMSQVCTQLDDCKTQLEEKDRQVEELLRQNAELKKSTEVFKRGHEQLFHGFAALGRRLQEVEATTLEDVHRAQDAAGNSANEDFEAACHFSSGVVNAAQPGWSFTNIAGDSSTTMPSFMEPSLHNTPGLASCSASKRTNPQSRSGTVLNRRTIQPVLRTSRSTSSAGGEPAPAVSAPKGGSANVAPGHRRDRQPRSTWRMGSLQPDGLDNGSVLEADGSKSRQQTPLSPRGGGGSARVSGGQALEVGGFVSGGAVSSTSKGPASGRTSRSPPAFRRMAGKPSNSPTRQPSPAGGVRRRAEGSPPRTSPSAANRQPPATARVTAPAVGIFRRNGMSATASSTSMFSNESGGLHAEGFNVPGAVSSRGLGGDIGMHGSLPFPAAPSSADAGDMQANQPMTSRSSPAPGRASATRRSPARGDGLTSSPHGRTVSPQRGGTVSPPPQRSVPVFAMSPRAGGVDDVWMGPSLHEEPLREQGTAALAAAVAACGFHGGASVQTPPRGGRGTSAASPAGGSPWQRSRSAGVQRSPADGQHVQPLAAPLPPRPRSTSAPRHNGSPHEYVVEVISPARARELAGDVQLDPDPAEANHRCGNADAQRRQSAFCPALLLRGAEYDAGHEAHEVHSDGGASVSVSSDEGAIRDRLKQSLQMKAAIPDGDVADKAGGRRAHATIGGSSSPLSPRGRTTAHSPPRGRSIPRAGCSTSGGHHVPAAGTREPHLPGPCSTAAAAAPPMNTPRSGDKYGTRSGGPVGGNGNLTSPRYAAAMAHTWRASQTMLAVGSPVRVPNQRGRVGSTTAAPPGQILSARVGGITPAIGGPRRRGAGVA